MQVCSSSNDDMNTYLRCTRCGNRYRADRSAGRVLNNANGVEFDYIYDDYDRFLYKNRRK